MSKLSNLRHQQLLEARAHAMRSMPSEPERVLWQALRSCQLGVRFRRQVVVAGAIVDFFAPEARLIVEVDGAHHIRRLGTDGRRDTRLRQLGLRVLRLQAQLVLKDLPAALACIAHARTA